MAEIIVGFKLKSDSYGHEEDRIELITKTLMDMGWTEVVGPRGESGMGVYINSGSLNTINEVVAYFKKLADISGERLLFSGDRLSIRVIGPRGGKAHYLID